jgi:hypothetical protein
MPVSRTKGSSMGLYRYRIIVSGTLGETTRSVFEDLCVEPVGANTGLTGELDQAGLYGVLDRIQALGLELVALGRLDGESSDTGDTLRLEASKR